jgi:hypothetical protein
MNELRYTLLSDGSSDDALIPLLTWLLREHHVERAIQSTWADLWRLRKPPKILPDRIKYSLDLYPCDLLFVHRDAESYPRKARINEIRKAIAKSQLTSVPPAICVVPVRMQEAWFLFDEIALRKAAGNPAGKQPLSLPPIAALEQIPDPKSKLYEILREASGLYGRRRKQLPVVTLTRRIAEFTDDFSLLRALPAFKALEADIEEVIKARSWDSMLNS